MACGSCSCCSALAVVAVIYLWHFHSSLIARKIDCFLCGNVSGIEQKGTEAACGMGLALGYWGCQRLRNGIDYACGKRSKRNLYRRGKDQLLLPRHIPAKSSESANGLCRRFFIRFPPPPAAVLAAVRDLQQLPWRARLRS